LAAGQGTCPYKISGYVRGLGSPVCYFRIVKLVLFLA